MNIEQIYIDWLKENEFPPAIEFIPTLRKLTSDEKVIQTFINNHCPSEFHYYANDKEDELDSHLWKLYNFIKEASIKNESVSVEQICNAFPNEYDNHKIVANGKSKDANYNYVSCPRVYEDIKLINRSYKIEKHIITNGNKIHLANEEELQKEIEKKLEKIKLIAIELRVMRKKKATNNQLKFINENSKARNYVESYLNDLEQF